MATFLPSSIGASSSVTGGSGFLNPLVGGTGAEGQAANQTWQNGQFMPYNLALPGANLNFNGNSATGSLNGPLGSMYGNLGNFASGLTSKMGYNPTAGNFLQGQYQNIFGTNPTANINSTANAQFQNLQQAEAPWLAQQRAQNLDSEMAKGTIASTAGQFQTAGLDQAQNSLMAQNANTAFQQALQQTGLQQQQQVNSFGAAANVGNLQEQESQFAPELATNQVNSAFGNLNSTNSALAQQLGLGANIGGIQSNANTNALQNNFTASQTGLQSQSGFLNNLLFGSGSGNGLLSSLMNGGSSTGGSGGVLGNLASKGINSIANYLFGGPAPSELGNLGLNSTSMLSSLGGANPFTSYTASQLGDLAGLGSDFGAPLSDISTSAADSLGSDLASELGFNGAGGQAAASGAGFLGGAGLGGLGAFGSGAAANGAVASALGSVGAQTAGTAAGIEAANDAAIGAGSSAASGAGAGALSSVAAPLSLLALPALLAAFVPSSEELSPQTISQMKNEVSSATSANGGPIGASYTLNPNGSINQQNYQTLTDLITLESENPEEFAQSGGTGPITQFLQSLGYNPINWSNIPGAKTQPIGSRYKL